jgi:hypothetical protein
MIFEQQKIEHGTANSYNKGCRCDRCRKAKSIYRKETPINSHGTKWYYDKGCRCDYCIDAKKAYRRKLHPVTCRVMTTDLANMTRICYSCKEKKSLNEFGKNKERRGNMGRDYECRICHNKRGRKNKNTPAHRFSTYINGAKVRNIDFDLSFEEFVSFWNKPCYYCDDPIIGIGLDRKDAKLGYSIGNVIPCCSGCNYMKKSKTEKEFIEMCIKVAKKFENHIVPLEHI